MIRLIHSRGLTLLEGTLDSSVEASVTLPEHPVIGGNINDDIQRDASKITLNIITDWATVQELEDLLLIDGFITLRADDYELDNLRLKSVSTKKDNTNTYSVVLVFQTIRIATLQMALITRKPPIKPNAIAGKVQTPEVPVSDVKEIAKSQLKQISDSATSYKVTAAAAKALGF